MTEKMYTPQMYTDGDYLKKNPTWDVEDSLWKAEQIVHIIRRNKIRPKTIAEVGCGAGEILKQLQNKLDKNCLFWGYEISPQAFKLCQKRTNKNLQFKLKDVLQEKDAYFDLMLMIDLIEHLEDYYTFLRNIKTKSNYKIFHAPLDLSVQTILRKGRILKDRKEVGHIHYFTKEIFLQILKDLNYQILDHFYTATTIDLPARSLKSRLTRLPRKLLFTINKDLAVRVLGGYSLIVLAK